jgi:hypothetical protein
VELRSDGRRPEVFFDVAQTPRESRTSAHNKILNPGLYTLPSDPSTMTRPAGRLSILAVCVLAGEAAAASADIKRPKKRSGHAKLSPCTKPPAGHAPRRARTAPPPPFTPA